jgi:hypothetical protein
MFSTMAIYNSKQPNHKEEGYSFSVDLLSNAAKHKTFLRLQHEHGTTLTTPTVESLRRYRDLWLPMVYENPTMDLVPPIDVGWLWHCHRLAPFRYVSFLKNRFGTDCPILEARPPFAIQVTPREGGMVVGEDDTGGVLATTAAATRTLWNDRYPGESFDLSETSSLVATPVPAKDSGSITTSPNTMDSLLLSGFDLLASTARQATFLWQVSGPRFADHEFLQDGVGNYYKFLQLRKRASNKQQVIVPTYQIDLMWHTHILTHLGHYYDDCRAIMGDTLHHDDSLNDRTEGGTLDRAFQVTKALWEEQYGEEYSVVGGMYRGEPPQEFFTAKWGQGQQDVSCLLPAIGPFLHMVGIQGASSTNPVDTWTNPDGLTAKGEPGFITPSEKSKARGVNGNPSKSEEGYIFGMGTKGLGYYHETTRDAYQILRTRIAAQVARTEYELQSHIAYISCFSCGRQHTDARTKSLVARLDKLKIIQDLALARSKADFPIGKLEIKERQGDQKRDDTYVTDGGLWYFPYDAGGGGSLVDEL